MTVCNLTPIQHAIVNELATALVDLGATSPTTDPGMAQDEGHNQAVSAARDMGDQGGVGSVTNG